METRRTRGFRRSERVVAHAGRTGASERPSRPERVHVEVTFDRMVTVTGAPRLALTVGVAAQQAVYAGGGGTATLSFAYRVQGAGDGGNGTGSWTRTT